MTGVYVGNTPVEPEKHYHELPAIHHYKEGDIWQCLTCKKMFRKEWQNSAWEHFQGLSEEGWYWTDYDGPVEKALL